MTLEWDTFDWLAMVATRSFHSEADAWREGPCSRGERGGQIKKWVSVDFSFPKI